MSFLALSILLQFRLFANGFQGTGTYGMEELLAAGGMKSAFVFIYGALGLILPISGLVVFQEHLRNKKFSKELGNTRDTVVVNLYFQIGHFYT